MTDDSVLLRPVAWMDREGDVYKVRPNDSWCPPHTPLYRVSEATIEAWIEVASQKTGRAAQLEVMLSGGEPVVIMTASRYSEEQRTLESLRLLMDRACMMFPSQMAELLSHIRELATEAESASQFGADFSPLDGGVEPR